jgi:hypothetical protein
MSSRDVLPLLHQRNLQLANRVWKLSTHERTRVIRRALALGHPATELFLPDYGCTLSEFATLHIIAKK